MPSRGAANPVELLSAPSRSATFVCGPSELSARVSAAGRPAQPMLQDCLRLLLVASWHCRLASPWCPRNRKRLVGGNFCPFLGGPICQEVKSVSYFTCDTIPRPRWRGQGGGGGAKGLLKGMRRQQRQEQMRAKSVLGAVEGIVSVETRSWAGI